MACPKRGLGPRGYARLKRRAYVRDDSGETLIELLVTIVVMGLAVVTILGSIATSVRMSNIDRQQVTAQTYLRSYASTIDAFIDGESGYKPCANTSYYNKVVFDSGTDAHSVTDVEYWNGSRFVSACNNDLGVQQLTLRVDVSNDPRVNETLIIIVREPCDGETACS